MIQTKSGQKKKFKIKFQFEDPVDSKKFKKDFDNIFKLNKLSLDQNWDFKFRNYPKTFPKKKLYSSILLFSNSFFTICLSKIKKKNKYNSG